MTDPDGADAADTDTELRALRAALATQREVMASLEARLARLEGSAAPPASTGPTDAAPATTAVSDRRQLLTRAATAAAGAVAGGAALALGQATPAAAAAGTFDGNPALVAQASPNFGTAVRAGSTAGIGLEAITSNGIGVLASATSGIGVSSGSESNAAVRGTTVSGTGVLGNSGAFGTAVKGVAASSGTGVRGESTSGTGVSGSSPSGVAVDGNSTSGTGVNGFSSNGAGVWAGSFSGRAVTATVASSGTHLVLAMDGGGPVAPPASGVLRLAGSVVRDANNDLWWCVASGVPGTWRKLSGPSTAGAFHALDTPVRVYDSRAGFPPAVGIKSPLVAGQARPCDLKANGSGVPAGATAALVSLVATNTTGATGGFLSVYRNGIVWPGTSSLNWSGPGQTVAVTTLTALDTNGLCNLFANVATNVVVDVLGYHR